MMKCMSSRLCDSFSSSVQAGGWDHSPFLALSIVFLKVIRGPLFFLTYIIPYEPILSSLPILVSNFHTPSGHLSLSPGPSSPSIFLLLLLATALSAAGSSAQLELSSAALMGAFTLDSLTLCAHVSWELVRNADFPVYPQPTGPESALGRPWGILACVRV